VGSLLDKFPHSSNKSLPYQGNTKILLVNSDYESAMTLKEGLEEYGFKVHCFTNIFAAFQEIEKSKRVNYDMVLCDFQTSSTEYLVPVKQIRELSNTVKIFLMSSCEIGDTVARNAMIAGVNEIIKKPISVENLNIILQDYIDGIKNPLDSALRL
jgi:DNA-binding NtrC family response regulator